MSIRLIWKLKKTDTSISELSWGRRGGHDRAAKKDLDGRDDAPFFRGSSKGMNFAFRIIII